MAPARSLLWTPLFCEAKARRLFRKAPFIILRWLTELALLPKPLIGHRSNQLKILAEKSSGNTFDGELILFVA